MIKQNIILIIGIITSLNSFASNYVDEPSCNPLSGDTYEAFGDYAYFTLQETLAGRDAQEVNNHDNEWMNEGEVEKKNDQWVSKFTPDQENKIITHLLVHPRNPDVTGHINFKDHPDDDNRMPLIVIHGVDGKGNDTDPTFKASKNSICESMFKQIEFLYSGATPENGFSSIDDTGYFFTMNKFLNRSDIKSKYRVYYYSYSSHKHITYNARKLGNLMGKIPYIKKWAKDNKKITFLAHSMGGLVARSMLEEHGGISYQEGTEWPKIDSSNFFGGLITLATPHHGTPAPIESWVDIASYIPRAFVSDVTSAGNQDLFWDNYDGVLFHDSVISDIYYENAEEGKGIDNCDSDKTYRLIIKDIRNINLNSFDSFYRGKIQPSGRYFEKCYGRSINDLTFDDTKVYVERYSNPWLTYLNSRPNVNQDKYYYYGGAHQFYESRYIEQLRAINIVNDDDYIDQKTTEILQDKGYFNDSIVPVSSSINDQTYTMIDDSHGKLFDDFSGGGKVSGPLELWNFLIDNERFAYIDNASVPRIRFFKDYSHNRFANGGYKEKEFDLRTQYLGSELVGHGINTLLDARAYTNDVVSSLYSNTKIAKLFDKISMPDLNGLKKNQSSNKYRKTDGKSTPINIFPFAEYKTSLDPLFISVSHDLSEIYCKSMGNSSPSCGDFYSVTASAVHSRTDWFKPSSNVLNKAHAFDFPIFEFDPSAKINRGEFIRMALVAFGVVSQNLEITPVPTGGLNTDKEFYNVAQYLGIMNKGKEDTLDNNLQRDEAAKIVMLLSNIPTKVSLADTDNYSDYESLKDTWYFKEGYYWPAKKAGILSGKTSSRDGSKSLNLQDKLTWAEASKMLATAVCRNWGDVTGNYSNKSIAVFNECQKYGMLRAN